MTAAITLIEVGPRDGLQNESQWVPTETKVAWINQLSESGLKEIEVTSFVSHKAIPQLADCTSVYTQIQKHDDTHYSALVPNEQGMNSALSAGVKKIAIFTAASNTFNQHNINCSIEESLRRCEPVIKTAKANAIKVRAYISCALGCPYEGRITPQNVLEIAEKLIAFHVDEISLGDTIGVGTPKQTRELLNTICSTIPKEIAIALHCHDTYGQAIANIYSALEAGITRFDTSTAGLGGCPYALGATGNVATEDVLYLMHGLGLETGIDIYKIIEAGDMMCRVLGRKNHSKVANALLSHGA